MSETEPSKLYVTLPKTTYEAVVEYIKTHTADAEDLAILAEESPSRAYHALGTALAVGHLLIAGQTSRELLPADARGPFDVVVNVVEPHQTPASTVVLQFALPASDNSADGS